MNKYAGIFFGFLIIVILVFFITRQLTSGNSTDAEAADKNSPKTEVVVEKYTDEDIAKVLEPQAADNYLGKNLAPVTLIEYASLTCPHCAKFHEQVVEPLIPTYIESGKVKLIYRDYPLDSKAFTASMIANCAGKQKFFSFIKVFFQSQQSWVLAEEEELKKIAKLGGIDDEKYKSCLANKEIEEKIIKTAKEANEVLDVRSTPTIFINGHQYKGAHKFEDVAEFIDDQLKGE